MPVWRQDYAGATEAHQEAEAAHGNEPGALWLPPDGAQPICPGPGYCTYHGLPCASDHTEAHDRHYHACPVEARCTLGTCDWDDADDLPF